ncbi:MAG: hypothetical protein QNJ62_06205 [Methyloceanibacter sp.]|nr:hypothetical protein [Methyloceanibacter sp.]
MTVYPTQATFTRGELTPRLHSRADIDHWQAGLKISRNFIGLRHGGIRKRSGTEFIAEVKNHVNVTRLIPFVFSVEQAYVLEFGNHYFRVFANGGPVFDGANPVEVTTPYASSQTFNIHYAQSADVNYLANDLHTPHKIERTSDIAWTITALVFVNQPSEWGANNWPMRVTFFQERLTWARNNSAPQTIWMSKAGALQDHSVSSPIVADDAITITILAGQVNDIRWIAEDDQLLIGTAGATRTLGPNDSGEPFSAINVRQYRQTTFGSNAIQPVQIGKATVFADYYGKSLKEFLYSFADDGYNAPDLTVLSEHLFRSSITSIAYAQEPDSIIWVTVNSGLLIGVTYDRDQSIVGCFPHEIGGDGFVECVTTIPGTEGDEVWLVVRRTIGGLTKRYIERLAQPFENMPQEDGFFVDSGLSYNGVPVNTVSGLDHLEGEEVAITADGAVDPNQTVVNGRVSLQDGRTASKIHVGLPYAARARTLPIVTGAQDGTLFGRKRRVVKAMVDFMETGPVRVGGIKAQQDVNFRNVSDPMDSAPPLRSGILTGRFDNSWKDQGEIEIVSDLPTPCTVRSITLGVESEP